MKTVHLSRKDETVDKIVRAAFPGHKGQKVQAIITDTVKLHGTNWEEGNKRDYVLVRLADLAKVAFPDAPYMQESPLHEGHRTIPVGFVVVCHVHYRGGECIEIIGPAANVSPLLPAPTSLTPDEETVLIATKSLKPSYAGNNNFRFTEARRARGITRERWDAAKQALIDRKLLNKAGAITVEGKNAIPALARL